MKAKKMTQKELEKFAEKLKEIQRHISFKISARGWCYQLENEGVITKGMFDNAERWVNDCRKQSLLPVDFVASEEARMFSGVEKPDEITPIEMLGKFIEETMVCEKYYTPDWWDGEKYYIQAFVEKIDLKTLFEPVCKRFHIPIATSRGWSSILQRADFARRFKEAEMRGLKCVLLYCGDCDPAGHDISKKLRKNLRDIENSYWEDGTTGYHPDNLEIDRFGLNKDFIDKYNLTWIDNLETGSGEDLGSPAHKHHNRPYVQDYIKIHGKRKCEANALIVIPEKAQQLMHDAITKYLGEGTEERFESRRQIVHDKMEEFRERTGLQETLQKIINTIKTDVNKKDGE